MEGSGEVSEHVENTTDALHLKRKENESLSHTNQHAMMGSAALCASSETEWHDSISFLRSPELNVDTFKGKNLVTHVSSQCGSESQGNCSHPVDNANAMVEELTLNNYQYPNISIPGSSNSTDESQVRQGLWKNFYKLVGDTSDMAVKELAASENRMQIKNVSFNELSPLHMSLDQAHPQMFHDIAGTTKDTVRGDAQSIFPRGIRTKVLPASGFPQFLVKSTLKGKGITYKHPGLNIVSNAIANDNKIEKSNGNLKSSMPEALDNVSVRVDDTPSLYGGGGVVTVSNNDNETNLRQWLKPGKQKINKAERLHIFRQIVELVDSSHSKGAALQHLQPSYFVVYSSNLVKYVGLFVPQCEIETNKTAAYHLKRKIYLDEESESHHFSQTKFRKSNENMKRHENHSVFGGGNVWKSDSVKSFNVGSFNIGSSGLGFSELSKSVEGNHQSKWFGGMSLSSKFYEQDVTEIVQMEKKWYVSPEELNGSACPLTSNIYSLGVLMFELFCFFESLESHAAAMLNLRHRILPSVFLSESPKEAGFCLWLLHPEPSSRPKCREVVLCDLITETPSLPFLDQSAASFDEEDGETELLLHFLLSVKEQKEKQIDNLIENIDCLRRDFEEVKRRRSSRFVEDLFKVEHCSNRRNVMEDYSNKTLDKDQFQEAANPGTPALLSTQSLNEERLMKNIDQLENAYFVMRSQIEQTGIISTERSDKDVLQNRERWPIMQTNDAQCPAYEESDRLGSFFDGLCKYARYSKFDVRGTLRNGDILNSTNVICSLSFDRDEEYFAAAGVSRKIKIFEYNSLLNDTVDIHYPAVEMASKSKLSCVCWNNYIKNYLASTDYDGVVQLWDAGTGQGFTQFIDHRKRAWSVDFSHVDPTKLASGSDDCSVKLWSINEKNCTNSIRNVANVCCVQFSAHSTNLLAFGSADYKIYCYDLRNTRIPWCTLVGHGKAVSYVKFVDSETLVSASTDNTLKLWDLNKTSSTGLSTNACSLTLSGHTNEKNFVGLSVSDGYIACGSETNEVFAYYKSLPMPISSHKFGSIDPISGQEIADDNGQFVSSVCWRSKSNTVVAANSTGSIKLLQMV